MKRLSTNIIPPIGPDEAQAYFIGEAPGREEDNSIEPFVGPAGQFLNRVMAKKQLTRTDYLFHNIFDQRPPNNNLSYFFEDKKPSQRTKLTWEGREHVEKFRHWLEGVWKTKQETGLGPNLIVALGRQSMFHLCGKKRTYKWRGSLLPCTLVPGFKVYPTLHPSHVMRTQQEEKVKLAGMKKERAQNALPLLEIDMDRIKIQMGFPEIRRPERTFEINLSFWELKAKLTDLLNKPERLVGVDIETLQGGEGPLVWYIGFSASPDYAFTIPLISVRTKSFVWSLGEEAELIRLISLIFLHKRILKIFQGGLYDLAILGRYYGLRCARGTYGDTMYCHHASYPYLWKSLEVLASIYTWEPYYKDEGRVSLGSRTDESEGRYNCKDCAVTREIYPITVENARELATYDGYKRTMSILPSHLAMTIRGVRIDIEGKKRLSKDFLERGRKAEEFVISKVGWEGLNLNSNVQKNRLLYGMMGLKLQMSRKTGKATADKNALNKLYRLYRKRPEGKIVKALMNYAKFTKLSSTYTEMKLDVDGRLRTSYSLVSTWRMNSSSSPFGGFSKGDREGGNLQNIPIRSEEGRMVRRLFIPDEGKVLLCSDRRQAEAMFVTWDSRDLQRIKMYSEGYDVHWYNAQLIFGIPPTIPYNPKALFRDSITGEEHNLREYRDIGKTIVYAGNYGMGPYKLQEILALYGFIFEFRESKQFLLIHKARNPHLLQWQREIREEVRATRTLISPIGRKREFMGRMNVNLYNAAYAFKPQNFVGELTEITIQRIHEKLGDRFDILMNVHDEVIGQCYPKDLNGLVRDIEELSSYPVVIQGRELDIPVDFKTGPNWADTEEVGR